MSHEDNFKIIKNCVDKIAKDCKLEGTIQHVNVLDAVYELQHEVNRVALLKENEK